MYRPPSRQTIIEALVHLRKLHRQLRISSEAEQLAADRREVTAQYLISNLHRTGGHPTLKVVTEVARDFSLTLGGAHELFGYDVTRLRELDLLLNGGRTHIVEAYAFERDRLIDLPLELAPAAMFPVCPGPQAKGCRNRALPVFELPDHGL